MEAERLPPLLARSVDNTSKEMTTAAAASAASKRRRTIRLISMTVSKLGIITKNMTSTLHFSGLYKDDELGRDVIGEPKYQGRAVPRGVQGERPRRASKYHRPVDYPYTYIVKQQAKQPLAQ
jgi:hypothetical protein